MPPFPDQHRKTLQRLMSEDSWSAVEAFLQDYMMRNFVQTSVKREDEFNTIWYAAENEGAKRHLVNFFKEMENEAGQVDTR